MVEGARLESVYRVKPIGGSNPFLSAKKTIIKILLLFEKSNLNNCFFSLAI